MIRAIFPLAVTINLLPAQPSPSSLWAIMPSQNLEQSFGGSAIVGGTPGIPAIAGGTSGVPATVPGVEWTTRRCLEK